MCVAAGKLHQQGEVAEAKASLERLGGVQGIATKLCSNVDKGINPDDLIERVEAYVTDLDIVSPLFVLRWCRV